MKVELRGVTITTVMATPKLALIMHVALLMELEQLSLTAAQSCKGDMKRSLAGFVGSVFLRQLMFNLQVLRALLDVQIWTMAKKCHFTQCVLRALSGGTETSVQMTLQHRTSRSLRCGRQWSPALSVMSTKMCPKLRAQIVIHRSTAVSPRPPILAHLPCPPWIVSLR